ncbi:hypothetical protein IJ095_00080 [Candidatus Saccharibacteria bacterium]|nr:hypothetical protein [Candidatus Saccharibacteria bacterium]
MFLASPADFLRAAKATNFVILSAPSLDLTRLFQDTHGAAVSLLRPDEKSGKISIEMVREFAVQTNAKDTADRFFLIAHAEALNPAAQNALLKNLEEPKPFHHFVLLTDTPSALLPTVLSRAQVFYHKQPGALETPVAASEEVKTLAKQLIVADSAQLITLANTLSKKKDNARAYALSVTAAAIEILYKSYFATSQEKFLKRLPNLLRLYDNLSKNGHIKLHIVADML